MVGFLRLQAGSAALQKGLILLITSRLYKYGERIKNSSGNIPARVHTCAGFPTTHLR